MTVQEFVEGYEKISNEKLKEDYIKRNITKEYMPYFEKIVMCRNIAKTTTHTTEEINDTTQSFFCENSIDRKMLLHLKIIEFYTNIDIVYDKTIFNQYDVLLQSKIISLLFQYIDNSEITLINSLLDMALNDIYTNECSVVNWLDNKFKTLTITSDIIKSIMSEIETE